MHLHGHPPTSWPVRNADTGASVNDVCRPCNEGWMSRIEQRAEPALSPLIRSLNATPLSRGDQGVVALWAYKRAIVFDLLNRTADRYFTEADRHELFTTQTLPAPDIHVWAAGFFGPQAATAVTYRILYNVRREHSADHPTDGYCLTLTVGHVALQVFTCHRRKHARALRLAVAPQWAAATVRLWPPSSDTARWPPSKAFDQHGLSLFIDRFKQTP